jgi:hypothetical protein
MARTGWTQARLADWLGTDCRTVERWLAGRKPPPVLCRAIRRSLDAAPHQVAMEYLARALEALQTAQAKPPDRHPTGDEEAALEEAARAAGVDPAVLRDAWLARQAQVPPAT